MATQAGDLRQIGDIAMKYVAKKWGMIINNVHKKWDPPDFGDASPKNTLIGQELLHQTIVNYKKNFSNIIIKVSPFGITI